MPSLRARHSTSCKLAGRETAAPGKEGEKIPGCTCKPNYSIRGGAGKGYDSKGRNLRYALRELRNRQRDEDEGVYQAAENLTFAQWSARWLEQLTKPNPATVTEYRATIAYAAEAFGEKKIRKLTPGDIAAMLKLIRGKKVGEGKVTASTAAKHLRVLGACLRSAVQHGFAGSNPIDRLPAQERPRAERRESAFFTDAELPRLLAEIPEGLWRNMFRLAFATGMRQGELAAITWGDIDLAGATIRVRRTHSAGKVGPTKGRTARTVDLPAEAVDSLGAWWGESGRPADDALVFPREDGGGFQPFWRFTRVVLYPALKRAGIDREGPTGELRDFHSTRHTFARIVLERGVPLSWLSRQLGHSSEAVTDTHYGHWSRERSKAEMERLAGAFAF